MTEKEFQLRLEKSEKEINKKKDFRKDIKINKRSGYFDLNRLEEETIRKYKLDCSLRDNEENIKKTKDALIKFWTSSEGNISEVKRYKYLLDIVSDRFTEITDERISKAILNNEELYGKSNSTLEYAQEMIYNNEELNKMRTKREKFEKFKKNKELNHARKQKKKTILIIISIFLILWYLFKFY